MRPSAHWMGSHADTSLTPCTHHEKNDVSGLHQQHATPRNRSCAGTYRGGRSHRRVPEGRGHRGCSATPAARRRRSAGPTSLRTHEQWHETRRRRVRPHISIRAIHVPSRQCESACLCLCRRDVREKLMSRWLPVAKSRGDPPSSTVGTGVSGIQKVSIEFVSRGDCQYPHR